MCKFLHEPQSYDKTGVFRWFKTLPLAPEFHPTLEEFKDPIGLPIRVGEKECSFYMRTGSCKYRESYRFRQPDPTAAGGGDTTLPGRRISSARTINDTATPLRSIIYGPTSFMPNMNGYELQNHINEEFRLPVILMYADSTSAELKEIQNGAVYVMLKPISIDEIKYIWQLSIWWQKKINGTAPSIREINNHSEENVNTLSSNGIYSGA
ncbi:zinc finger CCCH domain-containing protein 66 [Daucus carota subsp. sativus]